MDLSLLIAAAEHAGSAAAEHAGSAAEHAEEHNETPFYVAGSLWAAFAVAISVYGFRRPAFPETPAIARGVMSAGVALTLLAVGMAIYVAI